MRSGTFFFTSATCVATGMGSVGFANVLALFYDRRGSVFAIIPLPENPLGFSAYDEATGLSIEPSKPFVAKLVACHPPAPTIGRSAEKRGQFFGVSRHESVPVEANGHGRPEGSVEFEHRAGNGRLDAVVGKLHLLRRQRSGNEATHQ